MVDNPFLKRIEILMVEDSPTDTLIAQEALTQAKLLNTLHVVEDGIEAMAFLKKEGKYQTAPRPDLILLDLNLPRMSGREVLQEIKTDASLSVIPIVVLTTSSAEEDIVKAYGLHANCYVVKPIDFSSFVQIIYSISNFWFSIVTLPPEVDHESRNRSDPLD